MQNAQNEERKRQKYESDKRSLPIVAQNEILIAENAQMKKEMHKLNAKALELESSLRESESLN